MRPIDISKFRDEIVQAFQDSLDKRLETVDFTQKSISMTVTLKDLIEKMNHPKNAWIFFTPNAWIKIHQLVEQCDKEIAAHGIVHRADEPNMFIVSDILVYPQKITGATVESDDDRYGNWMHNIPDEQHNHMRFQMHSHVNMTVSPSNVDTTFYERLLGAVTDFYIFMIFNKRNQIWGQIFDVENNILYEDNDIVTQIILNDDTTYEEWADENISWMCIEPKKVAPVNTYNIPMANLYQQQQYPYEYERHEKDWDRNNVVVGGIITPKAAVADATNNKEKDDAFTAACRRYAKNHPKASAEQIAKTVATMMAYETDTGKKYFPELHSEMEMRGDDINYRQGKRSTKGGKK